MLAFSFSWMLALDQHWLLNTRLTCNDYSSYVSIPLAKDIDTV